MNTYGKLSLLLIILVVSITAASAAQQEKSNISLDVSNITSISDIIAPYYAQLAAQENIPLNPSALPATWCPDGSKILLHPLYYSDDAVFDALYILNADGTGIKEIIATHNNTKSRTLCISALNEQGDLAFWSPDLNRFAFRMDMYPIKGFYVIADLDGNILRVVGTDISTVGSIRDNIPQIPSQEYFNWNPNGTNAFVTIDEQLYLVDKDGCILQQLTNKSIVQFVSDPVWSNNGEMIAFHGNALWVINSDGTGLKQIYSDRCSLIGWSVDSSKLYYSVHGDENTSYYVFSMNDSSATKIYTSYVGEDYLIVGPVGKILFTNTSYDEDGNIVSSIYVADDDGTDKKMLGHDSINGYYAYLAASAAWSPGGDKIATSFSILNSDSRGAKEVTLGGFFSWHPSGNYIEYNKDELIGNDYFRKIYAVSSDGSYIGQISPTDDSSYDFNSWSPDGSRMFISRYNYIDYNGSILSSNETFLLVKFDGYNEVMSVAVPDVIIAGREFPIRVSSMSRPLSNALITIDGVETGTTNEAGCINYTLPAAGKYVLNASKDGYVVSSVPFFVEEESSFNARESSRIIFDDSDSKLPGFCFLSGITSLGLAFLWRRNNEINK